MIVLVSVLVSVLVGVLVSVLLAMLAVMLLSKLVVVASDQLLGVGDLVDGVLGVLAVLEAEVVRVDDHLLRRQRRAPPGHLLIYVVGPSVADGLKCSHIIAGEVAGETEALRSALRCHVGTREAQERNQSQLRGGVGVESVWGGEQ